MLHVWATVWHGHTSSVSRKLQIEMRFVIVEAFALNLNEDEVCVVLLGSDEDVVAGAKVKLKGTILDVPALVQNYGRVVNPMVNYLMAVLLSRRYDLLSAIPACFGV